MSPTELSPLFPWSVWLEGLQGLNDPLPSGLDGVEGLVWGPPDLESRMK